MFFNAQLWGLWGGAVATSGGGQKNPGGHRAYPPIHVYGFPALFG
jgi:hypothetical protein